jgi:hypothetical protein
LDCGPSYWILAMSGNAAGMVSELFGCFRDNAAALGSRR